MPLVFSKTLKNLCILGKTGDLDSEKTYSFVKSLTSFKSEFFIY